MNFKRKLQAGLIKPFRSKAYLSYVKSLECCGCGSQADDPHHVIGAGLGGGMGTKPSDMAVIPLCRVCHEELHDSPADWELLRGSQWLWVYLTLEQARGEGVLVL
jgi:hypothetical protein